MDLACSIHVDFHEFNAVFINYVVRFQRAGSLFLFGWSCNIMMRFVLRERGVLVGLTNKKQSEICNQCPARGGTLIPLNAHNPWGRSFLSLFIIISIRYRDERMGSTCYSGVAL